MQLSPSILLLLASENAILCMQVRPCHGGSAGAQKPAEAEGALGDGLLSIACVILPVRERNNYVKVGSCPFPDWFSMKTLKEIYTTEHLKENTHTKNKYSE